MTRNKYTQEYMEWLKDFAPEHTKKWLLDKTYSYWGYSLNMKMFCKLLSRYKIRPIDYNPNRATKQIKYPVGYERKPREDGMVMVKTETGWDYKQRVVWRKHHGEIPKDHYVIFLDGNRSNYDIDNLACVSSREASMIANCKLITNDKELTKTGVNLAKLMVKTKEAEGIEPTCHKRKKEIV